MSEATLLRLVRRCPHPAALARQSGKPAPFPGLRRLEQAGLLIRRGRLYRITRKGQHELELQQALVRALLPALRR